MNEGGQQYCRECNCNHSDTFFEPLDSKELDKNISKFISDRPHEWLVAYPHKVRFDQLSNLLYSDVMKTLASPGPPFSALQLKSGGCLSLVLNVVGKLDMRALRRDSPAFTLPQGVEVSDLKITPEFPRIPVYATLMYENKFLSLNSSQDPLKPFHTPYPEFIEMRVSSSCLASCSVTIKDRYLYYKKRDEFSATYTTRGEEDLKALGFSERPDTWDELFFKL